MPRDKLAAKFTGDTTTSFVHGLPARDIMMSEWEMMSDEDKALVAEYPNVYEMRNDADADVPTPAPAEAASGTTARATITRAATVPDVSKPVSDKTE